jgi:hypothetical protein
MAMVAIKALGYEPGVDQHDNASFFSCSRTRDQQNIQRQHGESSMSPAHNLSQFFSKWIKCARAIYIDLLLFIRNKLIPPFYF